MSSSGLPPSPIYVFRGHSDSVNTLLFYNDNTRLISGDAEGNVTIWDIQSRRPMVRFKAHENSILAVDVWKDKLLSHGRDNKIHIWDLNEDFNQSPKLYKTVSTNSLGFCRLATCPKDEGDLLIAVPGSADSATIDVKGVIQQNLFESIGIDDKESNGSCMALKLFSYSVSPNQYLLMAAYENAQVILWKLDEESHAVTQLWAVKEHNESVMGLDVSNDTKYAISVAGDNKIVKYRFKDSLNETPQVYSVSIKYPGIADVKIRSDGKIFATAGWDAKIRVFSKSLKPLAILSYHNESIYALAFSTILSNEDIDKHYLVGAGKDKRISLWEIY
ncbi:5593_t:CDS:2 [Paraglomus brasilianum]|uniref:ASTRA-associated protein 1 n=1 Tax=Paraglomus brasilianum TaxID=144538 RepID=A0A9N9A7R2_9GLOM|nr:5593_t:CDS:2 [Paraglomus brasilianum]